MTHYFRAQKNYWARLSPFQPLGRSALLALSAIALGAVIAILPVRIALAVIGGGALLVAALLEPLVGLAIMLLLGPTEPLLNAAGVLPFSIGQASLLLFAGAWLLRGLTRRDLQWPALPITIPFALFILAAMLSAWEPQFRSATASVAQASELVKWIEIYLIAGLVFSSGQKKWPWIIAIVFGVGVFQAGVGIWQFQFRQHGPEPFIILGNHYRAYGTLEQPNPYGGFMGIIWPVAAAIALEAGLGLLRRFRSGQTPWPEQRYLLFIFLSAATVAALVLGALVISFSRGAWLGAAAAGLAGLIFWPRKRWVGLSLGISGLVLVFSLYQFGLLPSFIASRFADVGDFVQVYDVRGVHISNSNFSIVERLAHWQAALNMAEAHPLLGVGFGHYEAAYDSYRLINWPFALGHAHMIYLNMLAETGLIGLIAYGILWSAIGLLTLRVSQRSTGLARATAIGLLGCWVHLATHQLLDNLYVGNLPLYIGTLCGLLCILATPTASAQTRTPGFHLPA